MDVQKFHIIPQQKQNRTQLAILSTSGRDPVNKVLLRPLPHSSYCCPESATLVLKSPLCMLTISMDLLLQSFHWNYFLATSHYSFCQNISTRI